MATTIGVKVEDAFRDRINALAISKDRTAHWIAKKALEQYVEIEEAAERERLEDLARWKEYELTGHTISNESATKWFDSLGTENRLPCPQ